jgi:hypothetical protein
VLPTVLLVGSTLIGGLVLGVQRVQAVYAAGTLSRAAARGEAIGSLATQLGVTTRIEYLADFVCVHAIALTQPIEIEERACARKLGL